jgi:hypothetical protein
VRIEKHFIPWRTKYTYILKWGMDFLEFLSYSERNSRWNLAMENDSLSSSLDVCGSKR